MSDCVFCEIVAGRQLSYRVLEAVHARVATMVHRVARLLNTALTPEGMNVKHNTGQAAGQDVFHFHHSRHDRPDRL